MKLRVIKYGAKWCHQCKQQDKEFKKEPLKEGVELVTVDIEDLPDEEVEKLGIKSIPVIKLQQENNNGEWEDIDSWDSLVKVAEINNLIEYL